MSRTDYLTLGIVAVCVVALAFLIYKFVTLNSEGSGQEQVEQFDPESLYDTAEIDTTSSGDTGYGDEKAATDYNQDTDDLDDSSVVPVDEYTPGSGSQAKTTAPAATTAPSAVSSSEGAYLVLAGSFREKANAESMAAKVIKLGYADATVELFDKGAYAVVLVARFDSYAEANTLVKELSGKGVSAAIHKKR